MKLCDLSSRGAVLVAAYMLAVCPVGLAAAPQAANNVEIYIMKGDYEIVAQGDGKTFTLRRLAKDGTVVESIAITKVPAKKGDTVYIDGDGRKYTQTPDALVREDSPNAAPPPPSPTARPKIETTPPPRAAYPPIPPPPPPPPSGQLPVEPPPPPPPASSQLPVEPPPPPPARTQSPAPVVAAQPNYNGPMSGTLTCDGRPVPQSGEKLFDNLPPLKLELHYDTAAWDARLQPGDNQTQRLVLKSRKPGVQKKCVVHWNVIE